ncbi:hypothetical protein SeMB42_g01041 [Synchytrium endobioticum]|nr:hypothetical protein SeMB42_g01041 [Synchytrium endobioticum]
MDSDLDLDLSAPATLSDLQESNIKSFLWGVLVIWQCLVVKNALYLYYRKRKSRSWLIYVMNAGQSVSMLIKTLSAAVYACLVGLDCSARAWMMTMFLLFGVELIYGLLLLKLLLFTPFRRAAQTFFVVAVTVHFLVVLSGTIMSSYAINTTTGICVNKYPILYKQQYTVEAIIEVGTFCFLVHGLAQQSDAMAIFEQLKNNEHLRVFLAMIFITMKIIFTYRPITVFDASVLTHGVDTARSGLVCWALDREDHKVCRALEKSMSTGASDRNKNAHRDKVITESNVGKSISWSLDLPSNNARNVVKSRYDTEDWEGFGKDSYDDGALASVDESGKRKHEGPGKRWTLTIDDTIEEKSSAEDSHKSREREVQQEP